MSSSSSEVIFLTVFISALIILLFGSGIVYFVFFYQKRRHIHEKEIIELRESFNQTLLQSKLEIQEQTLDHISKELHANFSHLVSLININLSELLPHGPAEMKESIVETKSLAKQLLSELKALSASLNTDHIMHIGFANALSNELARLRKVKKYQISVTKAGEEYRLSPEHEIILFRLCQEVFNNIVKYANATVINVTLEYDPTQFKLVIFDNGVGFDIQKAELQSAEKESTGILNIRKRAKLINANVIIQSQFNFGSTVQLSIQRQK